MTKKQEISAFLGLNSVYFFVRAANVKANVKQQEIKDLAVVP